MGLLVRLYCISPDSKCFGPFGFVSGSHAEVGKVSYYVIDLEVSPDILVVCTGQDPSN